MKLFAQTRCVPLAIALSSSLLVGCGVPNHNLGEASSQSTSGATLPFVAFSSPTTGYNSNGPVQVTGACTKGITVQLTGDLLAPAQVNCSNGTFSATVELAGVDGPKTIRASQSKTNLPEFSVTVLLNKDTAAPLLNLISPAVSLNVRTSAVVQGVCETGINVSVSLNGTAYNLPCSNGAFASTIPLSTLADGVISLMASQTDAAGNQAQITRSINKDSVAPALTIAAPAAGASVSGQATLSGSCESGLPVQIEGTGILSPVAPNCVSSAYSAAVVFTSNAGNKDVSVSQTDSAGNSASVSRTFNRMADTAPAIAITAPAQNTVFQNTLTVSGTCQTGLTVSFSGSGWTSPASTTCANGAFSATIGFTAGDGLKSIIASQTNAAGLTGSGSRGFVRDLTGPLLTITSPAANSLARTSLILSGACENGIAVQISGAGAAAASSTTCANGAYSASVNLSSGEGSKTLQVSQTDAVGNASTVSRIFVRDSVVPTLTIASPAAGANVSGQEILTGTCESGLSVQIDGAGVLSPVAANCVSSAYSAPIVFSAGAGSKVVSATQTDLAGNSASVSRTFNRVADAAPAIAITAPAENTVFQNSLTISGTCETGLTVNFSGSGWSSPASTTCASGVFSATIGFTAGDGLKSIIASQTNSTTGLTGSGSRGFVRDLTPPTLTIMSPAANSLARTSLTLSGACENGLAVQISGTGAVAASSTSCANGVYSASVNLSTGEGNKTLQVSQTDVVGNASNVSRVFVRDSVAPVLTIASPLAGANISGQENLTGTCESGLSVQIDGTGVLSPVAANCVSSAYSAPVVFSMGAGSKAVTVTQTDSAGNSTSLSRSFNRVADTPPAIFITAPAQNTVFQNMLTVSGTCQSGLTVNFSGSGWSSPASTTCANGVFSATIGFTSGDGLKNIIASQTSSAGLTGNDSRGFVRDLTAPTLTIVSPAANSVARTSLTLSGACENGIAVQISGTGAAAASSTTCANGIYSAAVSLSSGEGNKTIQVSQTDSVGNAANVSRVFVRDSVAPALTIASPAAGTSSDTGLTITGACEGNFAVVASGTGVASSVSQACAANAYSLNVSFSNGDGVKTVQLSQTDAAGNTATVSRDFMRTAPVLSGAQLYANNCAGCHQPLASSTKLNRTASQISMAISGIPQMNGLSFLTTAQRDAIAQALYVAPPTQAFACDQSLPPVQTSVRRLTKTQYLNTLQTLMRRGFNSTDQTAWNTFYSSSSTQSLISSIPNDGTFSKGNTMVYDTADQRLSDLMIRNMMEVAFSTAQWVVADSGRLNRFVRSFAGTVCNAETVTNTTVSTSCLQAFINGFGLRALRRPMQATNSATDSGSSNPAAQNDMAFYSQIFMTPTNGGFDTLIAAMLGAPDTIFLTPFKGNLVQTNRVQLTSYELAAKLSYYFTDQPPDETLLAAAQAQFTGAGNTVSEQVDRLFSTTSARERFAGFYRQWMREPLVPILNAVPELQGVNLTNLRNSSIQEILDMAEYFTFAKSDGKLAEIANNDISFATNPDLAQLYGVAAWSGKGSGGTFNTSSFVRFPASQPRGGMFTRSAYAFSGSRDGNIILRGARIRRDFLCTEISPPANTEPDVAVPIVGPPTARKVVASNTSGASCTGCHSNYINPLGFALENYDAFGRFRTMEPIYDANHNITQTVPVDAVVQPKLSLTDNVTTNDGVEFSAHLGQSSEFNSCFVRHYFRFAKGRSESLTADACEMQKMYTNMTATGGGSLQNMIKSVAKDADFQHRSINP